MAETSWIKLATNIPDHRKIKRIRKLPDGDKIILFWVFLLARAGDSNHSGGLFLTETLPYSVEDLSADFDFTTEFVEFGLLTLEKYSMITRFEEIIFIKNWEDYQAADSLEKLREQNRIRQARYREKQKLLADSNVISNDEITEDNGTEEELDKEKDIDKDLKNKKKNIKKEKFGELQNVLLSEEELEKLKEKFNDWEKRINDLSYYIASKNKKYTSHYATILSWARKDKKENKNKKPEVTYIPKEFRR